MADNIISQEHLLGAIDRILIKKSIALRCSDKQPMSGPLGIVLGMQRDHDTDTLKIERSEVVPKTRIIKTEFTQEALEDLVRVYGENVYDVLGHYIVDDLTYKIDKDFIDMLKARGESKGTLTFDGATYNNALWAVGQAISIKINKGLADLPISDNRSSGGFAIVSSDVASILAITVNLDNSDDNYKDDSPSYMGTIAGTEYYIDYTHDNSATDAVVFGIKGNGISKGSSILSPYTQEWVETIDGDSGEKKYHLFDRTGMVINPLDNLYFEEGVTPSAFVGKFDVDLSQLQLFS